MVSSTGLCVSTNQRTRGWLGGLVSVRAPSLTGDTEMDCAVRPTGGLGGPAAFSLFVLHTGDRIALTFEAHELILPWDLRYSVYAKTCFMNSFLADWLRDSTDLDGVLVEGDVHLVADLFHLRSRQRLGAQVPAHHETATSPQHKNNTGG